MITRARLAWPGTEAHMQLSLSAIASNVIQTRRVAIGSHQTVDSVIDENNFVNDRLISVASCQPASVINQIVAKHERISEFRWFDRSNVAQNPSGIGIPILSDFAMMVGFDGRT